MTLVTVRQAASQLGVGDSTLKHSIGGGRVRTRLTNAVEELKLTRAPPPLTHEITIAYSDLSMFAVHHHARHHFHHGHRPRGAA
jgi:hypothetical protein